MCYLLYYIDVIYGELLLKFNKIIVLNFDFGVSSSGDILKIKNS